MFFPMHKFLFNLSTRGMGVGNTFGEQRLFKEFYPKMLPENAVVVDIGAGSGAFLSKILEKRSDAKVFAFEPNPSSFKILKEKYDYKIKTFQMGVGRNRSTATLYDLPGRQDSGAASIHKEVFQGIYNIEKVVSHNIEITTLDEQMEKENIKRINLLKIDTEGNELDVLHGASKLLKENSIDIIQFEFNAMNAYSNSSFRNFWEILENYDFYRVLTDGLLKIDKYFPITCEIYGEQNFVAIRKDFKK